MNLPAKNSPPGPGQPKPFSLGDAVFAGLMMCIPLGMIVVPVGIMMEMWWLIVITPPAAIGAAALTMLITRAVGGNQAIRRGLGVAASTLGTAVGLFVVWFGVSSFLSADTCDPQIARCVVVINGVMSGESTESVRGQLFSAFMLSLAFVLPGLLLIGFCVRTIVKTLRSKMAAN